MSEQSTKRRHPRQNRSYLPDEKMCFRCPRLVKDQLWELAQVIGRPASNLAIEFITKGTEQMRRERAALPGATAL